MTATVENLVNKAAPWIAHHRNSLAGLLLFAIGVLVWVNHETFLWRDDWLYLQFYVEGPWSFLHHFSSDVKPLFQYILFAEFSSFGTAFHYYQFVNVVLLAACGFAFYHLVLAFDQPASLALFASLAYLVHPTNFVNTFWISGQCELIHIGLVLLAFLSYRKYTLSPGRALMWIFAISLVLQNFFFANGVFYPLAFLTLELLRGKGRSMRLVVIGAFIFLLHLSFAAFISSSQQTGDSIGLLDNLTGKILFLFSFTANSITRLIIPNASHAPQSVTHWVGLTALMVFIAWTLYRRRQTQLLVVSMAGLLSASIMLSIFRSSTVVVPYYYTSLQFPFLLLIGVSVFRSIVTDIPGRRFNYLWIVIVIGFGYADQTAKRIFADRNIANRQKLEQATISGNPYQPADDPALALPGYISINGKSSGETAVTLYEQLSLRDR